MATLDYLTTAAGIPLFMLDGKKLTQKKARAALKAIGMTLKVDRTDWDNYYVINFKKGGCEDTEVYMRDLQAAVIEAYEMAAKRQQRKARA